MPTDMDRDDILADFAMETDLAPGVLKAYIQQYPELALELTDLFHELTLVDLANRIESTVEDEEPESETSGEGVASVQSALSGRALRDLAHRLELPRDFVAGFRDARVRLGSVPASVLLNLARAIDVRIQYLIAYLQQRSGVTEAVAFKADARPHGPSLLEYDEFVESLGLDMDEAAALKRLAGSDGRR